MEKSYKVYTDGSGNNKTYVGAWAYAVIDQDENMVHSEFGRDMIS